MKWLGKIILIAWVLLGFSFRGYTKANPGTSPLNWKNILQSLILPMAPPSNWDTHAQINPNSVIKLKILTGGKSYLPQDSTNYRVSQGGVSFQINPAQVQVNESQFFSVYSESLKLGKDSQMVKLSTTQSIAIKNKPNQVTYYQQTYNNLPVIGADYHLMKNDQGNIIGGTGVIIPNLNINPNPSVLENAAFEKAKQAVPAKVYAWDDDPDKIPKGVLEYVSKNHETDPKSFKLVWHFDISTVEPFESYSVDVDAQSGLIVNVESNLRNDSENVPCTGGSRYDGNVSFSCMKDGDGYRLDSDPGISGNLITQVKIETIDERRPNTQGSDPDTDSPFWNSSKDNDFEDVNDVVGVSAFWGLQNVLEYYSKHFGWAGFDGLGKQPILMHLMKFEEGPNAFYYDKALYFDTEGLLSKNIGPQVDLDAIGHEFTHGVVDHTSNFNRSGEAGALNEAFADIFGILVKLSIPGKNGTWKYGENAYITGGFMRDLSNPKADVYKSKSPGVIPLHDPDTYKGLYFTDTNGPCFGHCTGFPYCDDSKYNDNCGVHGNALIVSHWFYLLVNGGQGNNDLNHAYKVVPVNIDEAAQIAFYTMTYGLTPNSNFFDASRASQQIAELQFGVDSSQAKSVKAAWYAVGIGSIYDLFPKNGDTRVDPWPAILKIQNASAQGSEWEFQISTTPDFSQDTQSANSTNPTQESLDPNAPIKSPSGSFELSPNTTYFWRARTKANQNSLPNFPGGSDTSAPSNYQLIATWFSSPPKGGTELTETLVRKNPPEWGGWEETVSFNTDTKEVEIISPTGGETTPAWNTEVTWKPNGAVKYEVVISDNPDVGCNPNKEAPPSGNGTGFTLQMGQDTAAQGLVAQSSGTSIDGEPPFRLQMAGEPHSTFALKKNKKYYLWIQAIGSNGSRGVCSNHGLGIEFLTGDPKVTLITPANGGSIFPWSPVFNWSFDGGKVDPSTFLVQVAKDQNFTSITLSTNNGIIDNGDGTFSHTFDYLGPNKYYWRVTAKRSVTDSTTTPFVAFTSDASSTKPVLVSPANEEMLTNKADIIVFKWKPIASTPALPIKGYYLTAWKIGDDKNPVVNMQYVDNSPNASTVDYAIGGYNASMKPLANSLTTDSGGYGWKVQAVSPSGQPYLESDTWIYYPKPDCKIITPANGATNVDIHQPIFNWTCSYNTQAELLLWIPGDTGYRFKGAPSNANWRTEGTTIPIELWQSTVYNWQVTASDNHGHSTVMGPAAFTTRKKSCGELNCPLNYSCSNPDIGCVLPPPVQPAPQPPACSGDCRTCGCDGSSFCENLGTGGFKCEPCSVCMIGGGHCSVSPEGVNGCGGVSIGPAPANSTAMGAPSLTCPGYDPATFFAFTGYYEGADQFVGAPSYQFKWTAVSGATNYKLTIYHGGLTPADASDPIVFEQEYDASILSSGGPIVPLQSMFEYRWEVRAKKSATGTWGPASSTKYFEGVTTGTSVKKGMCQ